MSRIPAEKRLERLLVMVPWIMQRDGADVDDVCSRFNTTEEELASDLELLFLCGLYPFTPDTLIEADIVDGRVWIRSADQFQRPPRFTAEEALALVAAASTIADLPGNEENDVLHNALTKLLKVLGLEGDETVAVELSPTAPQILQAVQDAAQNRRVLEVEYYSYGRDEWNLRRIEAYQIFNTDGQWYAQARAPEVDEIRNFRIDRMRSATVLDETFAAPSELPEARVYQARDTDPVAVIDLDQQVAWVIDQQPVESAKTLKDGKTRITLRVSEKLWLERLLLRLGPHASVVEGDVGVVAPAGQILARYERHSLTT